MNTRGFIDTAPFWQALGEGRLALQCCDETNAFQHYPRPVSVRTGRRKLSWREVSGRGKVYSFTVLRTPVGARAAPICVAIVELEEGVRMLANIEGVAPEALAIGQPVVASLVRAETPGYPVFVPHSAAQ